MQINEPYLEPVPWTTRDVWKGVASLGLWWLLIVVVSVLTALVGLDVNVGLFVGLAELLLLVPVWWLALRKYDLGWEALGLREFQGRMVGLGCGLMLLSSLFNAVFSAFLAFFELRVQDDLVPVFAELSSPWWLLVAGVVVAPIVEEIFFRGFVFAGLRKQHGWKRAAVISSALFALIHLEPTAMLPIFVLGYIFAYLYERSGSLGPAILMHVSTNALALGIAYLMANTDVLV